MVCQICTLRMILYGFILKMAAWCLCGCVGFAAVAIKTVSYWSHHDRPRPSTTKSCRYMYAHVVSLSFTTVCCNGLVVLSKICLFHKNNSARDTRATACSVLAVDGHALLNNIQEHTRVMCVFQCAHTTIYKSCMSRSAYVHICGHTTCAAVAIIAARWRTRATQTACMARCGAPTHRLAPGNLASSWRLRSRNRTR